MLGIRLATRPSLSTGENVLQEFFAGLRYVVATSMILASTVAAYVISVFVGTYTRFMAVFAKDVLNVGPDGLGLLMAAPGVGAVLSLIVLGALEERWSRRTLLGVSAKTTPADSCFFVCRETCGCRSSCLDYSAGCRSFFAP
ncbi:MAG TPA: MFS transporter [Verrucomicrobiae bacterium]|nr:MFS transporter [Verrucomicrobiae bacterium]